MKRRPHLFQSQLLQSRLRKSPAFTLIELLIVIAIIALLAAILFPVFARAREKARQASCASNLKQLGMAIMQYSQDYDEHFLIADVYSKVAGTAGCVTKQSTDPWGDAARRGAQCTIWADLVLPYTKSQQVYACPSMNPRYNFANEPMMSYGYNLYLAFSKGDINSYWNPNTASDQWQSPMSHAVVAQPARVFMLFDEAFPGLADGGPAGATNAGEGQPAFPGTDVATDTYGRCASTCNTSTDFSHHSEGVNICYVDGHVKWSPRQSGMASGLETGWQNWWLLWQP